MEQTYNYFASVIIPVYNDAERLKLCLEALAKQSYPDNQFEILVVDNASTEDIKSVAEAFPQVVLIHESQPGSYAARNRGIAAAEGQILAFTDSDCIPSSGWLENGVRQFLNIPNCGIVAGKIEFFFKDSNCPNAVELYDSIELLQQEEYVKQGWGATANLFTTPAVFTKAGLFNAELKSGGDFEWGRRVAAQNYEISYAPDSVVAHPARSSLKEMHKKIVRRVGGGYALRQLNQHKDSASRLHLNEHFLTKLRPPIRSAIRKSFLNQKLSTFSNKVMIFSIVFILHYLELAELVRLQLGGKPSRQ
ncbi:glycosyl transferase family 2 [filamentous cyanobacterium CCP5]|nr:glycosyl transferase family 2 [filamentous cyanobacterium CCP5]